MDSAVSAYLLKQQGHDIVGGFMLNYLDENDPHCSTKLDMEEFHKVCQWLDIPYEILDFRKEYEEKILNYIYEWYLAGITPNPDVLCNTEIKFRLFLDEALKLGYDKIATGHYAQIKQDLQNHTYALLKWSDNLKDQSYFLAWLDQFQLSKALFPIGDLKKSQVRQLAQDIWLPNANRKDSQGLCFVGKVAMSEFLHQKIGSKPGNIVLQDGTIVWQHDGAYQFTVWQRRGIGLHFQAYVTEIDIKQNTVIVSKDPQDKDLFRDQIGIKSMHWISWHAPDLPLECKCKVRYRQELQDCKVIQQWEHLLVHLDIPQKGVPNGQIIVLYGWENHNEVLGSGEIGNIG